MENKQEPNKKNGYKSIGIRERILLIASIILVIIISVKSIYFDPYHPQSSDDFDRVETYISENYDSIFYDSGFFKIRVINYKESDADIKLHLRKYLVGLIPVGDVYTIVK